MLWSFMKFDSHEILLIYNRYYLFKIFGISAVAIYSEFSLIFGAN